MNRYVFVLVAWTLQQLSCLASAQAGLVTSAPVHRFWSPVAGRHFFTLDEAEKAKLLSQYAHVWAYEGVAFRAFPSDPADGSLPVYRFWSPSLRTHFFTLDPAERDRLLVEYPETWTYEGVAFYAYAEDPPRAGTLAVHRFWSGSLGTHFYTASDRERFKLVSSHSGVWDYEGVAWYAYPPEISPLVAVRKGPFVPWVTSDSATIVWETDSAADSTVRCETGAQEVSVVFDRRAATLHKVVLTGLAPAAVHTYTVTSGPASRTGAFRTAPQADQPFRFVVYGDTRTNVEVHRQVVADIVESGPDLVFHTGDLVGAGRDYEAWDREFFDPAGELLLTVPVVPVPGNHEYGGKGPPWFLYFFHRPIGEGWFALTYGNARFIGLDTNVDYSPGSAQYQWLEQELQSGPYGEASWHVVLLHHPPFTATTGHTDNLFVRRQLVPLLEQHGVDIVFSGHSHAYERYLHNGIHYIVTGGGGAPLYDLLLDAEPPVRQFGLAAYHYCVVNVDPSAGTLLLAATDLEGRIFDTITLSQ